MGQFDDVVAEDVGGTELSPSPVLDPVGQQNVPLPDISPIVSSAPRLPMPPPPSPPPQPMQDPRQRLLALFTTAFALGAGPHSGEGVGALSGLNTGQQALQAQQMDRWKFDTAQKVQQAKYVEQQQAELDRQRALKLQTTFENFRKDMGKVQSEDDYRKLVGMYAGGLQAAGYRITPEYFYQNFKFTPPTEQESIQKALSGYYADPLNKQLLASNPDRVESGAIEYRTTLHGQPVTKRLSIADARKALGIDNNVINGQPLFSTIGKGTEIQQATARATSELEAQLGRQLKPSDKNDNNLLMARVRELTNKTDPLVETERRLNIQKLRRDLAQPTQTGSGGFEFTPDKPKAEDANKVEPTTGLTPNALYQNAMTFALEGKMPSLGLGSRAQVVNARNAIQNKAGAMAAAAGVTLPQLRAEYAANRGTVAKIMPQVVATESAANAATDNLDLALGQSAKVARTGSRFANRYLQWAQGNLTPARGLTEFETYVYTAAREYAKVTSGGALSAQGLTDSAAKEAEKLLSATQSPQQFEGAVTAMKHDMANVVKRKREGLAGVSKNLASFLAGEPVQAATDTQQQQQETKPPTALDSAYQKLKKRG